MSEIHDDEPTRLVTSNNSGASPLPGAAAASTFDPLAAPAGPGDANAPTTLATSVSKAPAPSSMAAAAESVASNVVSSVGKAQSNVLPTGTRIAEFEITKVIGVGGFGIVYLAHDHSLQRIVALKEYMPASFAQRADGLTVSLTADEHAETFVTGLRSFVNEAHLLAQFDHASLVKVYRFWEANGTAYMVMPYYEAPTLKAVLQQMGARPTEQWLKEFLSQLLDALDIIHAKQCYHRDIAPDNILMLGGQRPVLLDFGAARRVIEGREQALTVILKAGYAPIEQYGSEGEMLQGPWTDLYALASVVYYAITGKVPPAAVQRVVGVDPYQPLAKTAQGQYSDGFLQAIDAALAIQPKDRPQNVAAFRQLLGLDTTYFRQVANMGAATSIMPGPAAAPAAAPAPAPAAAATTSPAPAASAGGKPWLLPAIGAGVVVLAAAGWFLRPASDKPGSASVPVLASASVPAPTSAPAPTPMPPAPTPVPPAATPAPPAATPAPTPAPAPVAKPEFDPVRQLSDIVVARDAQIDVTAQAKQSQVKIGKDKIGFSVTSSQPGFVYVLMLETEHKHLYLMFPNKADNKNRIDAGKPLNLPGPKWELIASGPVGTDQYVVMVSKNERNFSALGLKPGLPFAEIDLKKSRAAYQDYSGAVPFFAGKAVCKGEGDCANNYGAASFTIETVGKAKP